MFLFNRAQEDLTYFTALKQYVVLTLSIWNNNVRLQADHFLEPQIYSKGFFNNKPVFDRKLTFNDCVSQFSTEGQVDYAHASHHA